MKESAELTKPTKIEFEKSIKTKEGLSKRIRIEAVENGYITTIDIEGEMKGKYIYECKKYISTKNPLKQDKSEFLTLKEFLAES